MLPFINTDTRAVTETETYKTSLFGWQLKTHQVSRTIGSRTTIYGSWLLSDTKAFTDVYNSIRYQAFEYKERNQRVLDTKGGFWKIAISEGFEELKSGGTNRRCRRTSERMTDTDILALEYEYPYRVRPSTSKDNVRGNRDAGRIIRRAKGINMSLALKDVFEGVSALGNARLGDIKR